MMSERILMSSKKKENWLDNKFAMICLFVFALAVRALYLFEIHNAPIFSLLMGDAASYDVWARGIAGGNWFGGQVFYQAPLYPYFLGLIYFFAGHNLFIARLVQIVIGATSCLLVAKAGESIFSRTAGLISGFILAVYPVAIYFDCLIQKAVLGLFFMALLIYIISQIINKPSVGLWLATGITVGLFALVRENALIFLPTLPVWLFVGYREYALKTRLIWCLMFALGTVLVLCPVGFRNYRLGGNFLPTTSQLGSNLYIGNNPRSQGGYTALRFQRGNAAYEQQDALELAEKEVGRPLAPGEVSTYWTKKTLDYIFAHPGQWAWLMGRKLLLVFNTVEATDTEHPALYSQHSLLLRFLLAAFSFGLLFALAVFSIGLSRHKRTVLWPYYLVLGVFVASIVLFYVFSRYRLPIVAILSLLAGEGLMASVATVRAKQTTKLILPVVLAAGAFALANLPLINEADRAATAYCNAGAAFFQQEELTLAVQYYQDALALRPNHFRAHMGLGETFLSLERPGTAVLQFKSALTVRPDNASAHNNLGLAFARLHDAQLAVNHFKKALECDPDNETARRNLDLLLRFLEKQQEEK